MTRAELLAAFAGFSKPHEVRESPRAAEVLDSLSKSPEEYVAFVEDHYGPLTRQVWDSWTDELVEFSRVERILIELLYVDGRTLEALLWVVGWASRTPGMAEMGINPLAAITSVCRRPLPRIADQNVVAQMTEWMKVPDLEHNARACRYEVLRRRPDLPNESGGA